MLDCVVHTEAKITRSQSMAACDDSHKRFKTPTLIFYRASPYKSWQFSVGPSVIYYM